MQVWSQAHLPAGGADLDRLRALLQAMTGRGPLAITEVSEPTPSAAEAFATRRADCVGFALLFVALARSAGVEAGFVLSATVEQIDRRASLVLRRTHLAAAFAGRVFDLGGESAFDPARHRAVADRTALALFFSNRGVQSLAAGHSREAVERLYDAVRLDPSLAWVWTNLGVALRRSGDAEGAVLAYELALRLDPSDQATQRNLAVARESVSSRFR
jgi:tetratricopeptide (TPR) repeat protein